MRVALIGNMGNNLYRLGKWLREAGVDAHLYLLRQERGNRCLPEEIDPHIAPDAGGYPDWIHQYDDRSQTWFLRRSRVARDIDAQFDVLVTMGARGLVAVMHFRRIPILHWSSGSEVSEYPLWLFARGTSLRWRVVSLQMRRALQRVRLVVTGFEPEVEALRRLGLERKTRIWGGPEDVRDNLARIDTDLADRLRRRYEPYRRVFLWLSRLNFADRSRPVYKGPEIFLDAFERLAGRWGHEVRAVIGTHGDDVDAFVQRVQQKHLGDTIDFVPHLPYAELLAYLALPRAVVVDNLAKEYGVLAGMARDALSVGAVTVKALDRDFVRKCHGEGCPILDAEDAETCYQAMNRLVEMDDAAFGRLQDAHRAWAMEHIDYHNRLPWFIERLEEIAAA